MFILRPIRMMLKALVQDTQPSQLALGMGLGLAIGLVPKGNLLAIGLMVVLGVLRVNLGIGMLMAFVVSWLSVFIDPISNWIGLSLLNAESLKVFWTDLYNMPFVPWTNFNNTVVLGGFVLGVSLLIPVYFISRPVFAKYMPRWEEKVKKSKLSSVLLGGELGGKLT
jgi:uncharacterized protein (TIGR03546 family)